jgi:hypothetical protein
VIIALFSYITLEITLVFAGLGFGINSLVNGGTINWVVVAGSSLLGLALGLIFGWVITRSLERPPRQGWLWAFTFGLAAVAGFSSYWLHLADWKLAIIIATFGSLLGLVVGVLVNGMLERKPAASSNQVGKVVNTPAARSLSQVTVPYSPGQISRVAPRSVSVGSNPAAGGPQSLSQEVKRLRKLLYNELQELEKDPNITQAPAEDGPKSRLFVVDRQRIAVIFNINSYLGRLNFYIVCNTSYPHAAPEEVHMELMSEKRTQGQPTPFAYDGRLFSHWTEGCNLTTVIKDGFLQIEEALL